MNYNNKHGGAELEVTCMIPDGMEKAFAGELERIIPMVAEAVTTHLAEADDPICMMLMPDGATAILPYSKAKDTYDEMQCNFCIEDALLARCEASNVTFLGDHLYLTGPVLFYEVDEDGDMCNIDAETVVMAMDYFDENVTRVEVDGKCYAAIRLS